MKIKGTDVNIDQLIEDLQIDHDFYLKRKNGIMLKDSQIEILEKYHIFYQNYTDLSSLIFAIEEALEEMVGTVEAEDLETVSAELSELHYYHETNK